MAAIKVNINTTEFRRYENKVMRRHSPLESHIGGESHEGICNVIFLVKSD